MVTPKQTTALHLTTHHPNGPIVYNDLLSIANTEQQPLCLRFAETLRIILYPILLRRALLDSPTSSPERLSYIEICETEMDVLFLLVQWDMIAYDHPRHHLTTSTM